MIMRSASGKNFDYSNSHRNVNLCTMNMAAIIIKASVECPILLQCF